MKPLTLKLAGFRSYPTAETIDLTGKTLVAVLGDTGAGKSSLLDAVTYALFRKSTWAGRELRHLIADGATAMSVELTFLHDGQRWRIQRTMHADNPSAGRHSLTNLDDPDDTVDNAAAVDARIEHLLGMGHETFLRVGLLPQGKFDQLLTASPKDRTARLRELFGADGLQTVHDEAARRASAIRDLVSQARILRAGMPADPAATALEARTAAESCELTASQLTAVIDTIERLQTHAAAAEQTRAATQIAAHALNTHAVRDAHRTLDRLQPVEARLATRRAELNDRQRVNLDRKAALEHAARDVEERGESPAALHKAAAIVDTLARRASEIRDEHVRLEQAQQQLTADAAAITRATVDLAERTQQVQPLEEQARQATLQAEALGSCATSVSALVAAAIDAARKTEDAAEQHRLAEVARTKRNALIEPAERRLADAEKRVTKAEQDLEALRTRHKAALIASALKPGDDCPVCSRTTPANFAPPPPPGGRAMRTAETEVQAAREERTTAGHDVAQAKADTVSAQDNEKTWADEHRRVAAVADQAKAAAARALEQFSVNALKAPGNPEFETTLALSALNAACDAPALRPDDTTSGRYNTSEPIAAALAACHHHVTKHAEQLRLQAHTHAAALTTDGLSLEGRKKVNQRATAEHATATRRHAESIRQIAEDVASLPPRIRDRLPSDATTTTATDVHDAGQSIAQQLQHAEQLASDLQATQQEETAIITGFRVLDQETADALGQPLDRLRMALVAWARAASDATQLVADAAERPVVPSAPEADDTVALRRFADELVDTDEALASFLDSQVAACTLQIDETSSALREQIDALPVIEGFDRYADRLSPAILRPLSAAAGAASSQALAHRAQERQAAKHIQQAAALDAALEAGDARLEALEVLRYELVDAKFLSRLVGLRTQALLGVASELLGQMTGDQFGFADNFEIISRASDVVHTPNRLSGGEKFLASLALALALAEVYSRSGPPLGSLFLDEGFAALDTGALEIALDVLRARAGGDRLVMVISHLHAVAEAVNDVLWVERRAAGSTTRWLTAIERDELVDSTGSSGLQTLAVSAP